MIGYAKEHSTIKSPVILLQHLTGVGTATAMAGDIHTQYKRIKNKD
jgi:hypothetical protein